MAKKAAVIFGIVFVIAGIWGLFSSPVLGFIVADVVSSIIHIIVGLVLLMLASKSTIGTVLKVIGILYVIIAILGLINGSSVLGIFVTDSATNWFYLIVGVVIAVLGFTSKGSSDSAPVAPQM